MLDLPTLGQELRRIRRGLRIPSAELARRIGVSQTYVWLIEEAKPRKSGEPSRPGEELLARWTAALGMSADEARRIHELAGYFDSEALREHREARRASPRSSQPATPVRPAGAERGIDEKRIQQDRPASVNDLTAPLAALRHWAGNAQSSVSEADLIERLYAILQDAERNRRSAEAVYLLDSLLRWLEFHLVNRS